jgi:hypothetical protein
MVIEDRVTARILNSKNGQEDDPPGRIYTSPVLCAVGFNDAQSTILMNSNSQDPLAG